MSIGENIKRYRCAAGLSQEELADRIGKTRPSVSYYESGKIMPPVPVIERIAYVLGVSKMDIIDKSGALSAYEKELLDVARTINANGRRELLIYARGLAATYPQVMRFRKRYEHS